jgi:hypothetical protein
VARVESRRFGRVMARMEIMAVGEIRFARGLLVTSRAVMIPRLGMMLGGVLEMLGCFSVMLNGFDRHIHRSSEIESLRWR